MAGRPRVSVWVMCIAAGAMASSSGALAAESLTPRRITEVSMAGREAAAPASQDLETLRQGLREQMRRVDEQARLIEAQRQQLDQQRRQIESQQRQLEAIERLMAAPVGQPLDEVRGGRTASTASAPPSASAERRQMAQAEPQAQAQAEPQPQAGGGAAPTGDGSSGAGGAGGGAGGAGGAGDAAAPDLADVLEEVGRVLTRKGTLIVEPQFQYSHNTAGRFFFNGVEIFPGFNIGVISITDNKRNTFTNSVGLRYGITNRFEADLKVPFVINQEEEFSQILTGTQGTETRSVSNQGLGDVEFGVHYQINRGRDGWPFFVGNVRVKTPTGEGPFDIDQRQSAPTGSGFWGVEPSITVIYPSDPGVLFANVGYMVNMSSDVESRLGDSFFTTVNPGNVLRTSFGYGIGLNERLSVNFGYKHDWVQGTKLSFRDAADATSPVATQSTGDFQVGALQFGISYKVTPSIPVIVSVSAGVTNQAPDAEVGIRVPVPIQLFD
jgi:hypothetical protein